MFFGVRSYESALSCHDYESARRSLDKASRTPKLKRLREPKQYGFHMGMGSNHGVTWVREMTCEGYEGAIAFRLYDTDVVVWHPDNSVEIDNYGTVTTGGFARTFLPAGISLSHVTARRGECGGHKGITYRAAPEPGESTEGWRAWYAGRRICFGGLPRFRLHGEHWLPDEDTLDSIRFPEITDRKAQRAVAAKYHLKDFATWLSMAPMHMPDRIEHDGWSVEDCAEALLKRDFTLASTYLPLLHDSGAFGNELKIIPIMTSYRDQFVTVSSIDKLKLALWDMEGLIEDVSFKTLSEREFDRRTKRAKQMQRLGLHGAEGYGAPRW